MRKVKAIFVGQHGSESYLKQCQYTLKITQGEDGSILIDPVNTAFIAKAKPVKYASFFAFMDNWDNIIIVK